MKKASEQLDLFENNEPVQETVNQEPQEPQKPQQTPAKKSPELVSAWREPTGQYAVLFWTPSGKYYMYNIGFYKGKSPLAVQNWIKMLANKDGAKNQALEVAEQSAIDGFETDRNQNIIRELDLKGLQKKETKMSSTNQEYTPLFERTSSYKPVEGPWGRPSDLVRYASNKGWLTELGVSLLDEKLIIQAKAAHDNALEELKQKEEWTGEDTERTVKNMLQPFGEIEMAKKAGKQKSYDTTEKSKDKMTINQEDLITKTRMPEDLRQTLQQNKPKVEQTQKDKQRKRRGKFQQKEKQKLRDYTRR